MPENTTVRLMRLDKRAIIPTRGSEYSAGSDLYALDGTDIPAGGTVLIHTGLAVEIPQGNVGLVCARSGLATKRGIAPANKVGVVDSDYRGELMVSLHNHSREPQRIDAGERVAQLVIVPYTPVCFEEAASLSSTERGDGGFGSTGSR